ncbi:MAG: flagellin domain protein [Magnetococcales bacterium]|nr:flagellin domain protein [Magnetococcales bacterium]
MVLAIHNDIPSMNTQRNVLRMNKSRGGVFERMASGLEISRTVDDSTGLSIGVGMTVRIRGINQTMRNANEAVSLVQVAQGAVEETANALQEIRKLAIHAANDTQAAGERQGLQDGVNRLLQEITRIVGESEVHSRRDAGEGPGTTKNGRVGVDGNQAMVDSIKEATTASLLSMGRAIQNSTRGLGSLSVGNIDRVLNLVADLGARLEDYQERMNDLIADLGGWDLSTVGMGLYKSGDALLVEKVASVREILKQDPEAAIQTQANQGSQSVLELLGEVN